MGLNALIFGRDPNALSLAGLRIRFSALRDARQSATAQLEAAEAGLAALRQLAARAGLADELRALESPPAPAAVVRETKLRRVRLLESFSGEHEGIPVFGPAGDIQDLPASYAWRLAEAGIVELVAPETPLRAAGAQR